MKRLGQFLRSSMDALLAPAVDPRSTYPDPGQRQTELLAQVSSAAVRLAETRKRLESQRASINTSSELLDREARSAIADGREDLARLALRRQRLCLTELGKFDRQIEGLRVEERQLEFLERRVRAQIEAVQVRERMAEVRRSAAQAHIEAGEALSGIGTISKDTDFLEQIERDAEDLEARADAIDELIETGILGQGIRGTEFSYASGGSESETDAEIELRLRELKQQQTAPPSQSEGH
jgi:phage shock protein A